MIIIANVIVGFNFGPYSQNLGSARVGEGERASKRHSGSNGKACLFVSGSTLMRAINGKHVIRTHADFDRCEA
jgi:hypothetical protein